MDFKNRFIDFLRRVSLSPFSDPELLWAEIEGRYGEKHRVYHTLDHIGALLTHLDGVKKALDYPDHVEAAIWYHDLIYKTLETCPRGGFDNELESADRAVMCLAGSSLNLDTVHAMILMTKHGARRPKMHDEAYMVDMDISILGQDPAVYQAYAQHIRQEYQFVPEEIYQQERIKVLESFLKSKRLYQTEYFCNLFEARARLNLEQEINTLSQRSVRPSRPQIFKP